MICLSIFVFCYRMQGANADSFLEELSPLSEALVSVNIQNANIARTGFYITIGTEKCFKPFASKFFEGVGNVGLSGALDEIRGMETFRNLHSIAFDNSDSISFATKKKRNSFSEEKIAFKLCGIILFCLKWK